MPMTSGDIARLFRGPAKPRIQRIDAILLMLTRYGDITRLEDGRYATRRAA